MDDVVFLQFASTADDVGNSHLERLANEDGVVDPKQPRGRAYFAESGARLDQVFRLLAQDLTVRLAR